MSKRTLSVIKYAASAAFTVLVGVIYLNWNDFSEAELTQKYCLLSDALSVPGYLMLFSGMFIWMLNKGALDGVSYCLKTAADSLIPGKRIHKGERYGDYVERKREKPISGYGFLLISGAIALVLSIPFLLLYYFG